MGKSTMPKRGRPLKYVIAIIVALCVGSVLMSVSMGESEVRHVSLEQESQNIIATTESVSDAETVRQRLRTERTNGDCIIAKETYQRASPDKPYIGPPQISIKPCAK